MSLVDRTGNDAKLSDLADLLISWRMAKDDAEENLKKANEQIRLVEQEIVAKLQTEEIDKFAHAGQLFFPRVESHPSINKEKEAECYDWFVEHNEDGIYKLTAHPSTLKAWYKQNSEKYAEELSSKGLLKVYEEIRISVRKA